MKKTKVKNLLLLLSLAVILVFCTGISAFAAANPTTGANPTDSIQPANTAKDEVVYGKLSADGQVQRVYVVNVFSLPQPETVIDYGEYSHVTNLSNTAPITYEDGMMQVEAEGGGFYYQGDLPGTDLPWLIDIRYFLDGVEVAPQQLSGASGHLRLEMEINPNPAVNSLFFENYALQVTMTWPENKVANIQADQATIAYMGANRSLSYIVFANRHSILTAEADINDFSMSGIQFAGISLALSLDDLDTADMLGDLHKLQNGIVDLDDGVLKLNDGVIELNDGVITLYDGVAELDDKSGVLADGAAELNDGSFDLLDAVNQLKEGMGDFQEGLAAYLDGVDQLHDGAKQLRRGGADLYAGAELLTYGNGQTNGGFRQFAQGINQMYLSYRNSGLVNGAAALMQGSADFISVLRQQITAAIGAAEQYAQQVAANQQAALAAQGKAEGAQKAAIGAALAPIATGLGTVAGNPAATEDELRGAMDTAIGQLSALAIDTTEVDRWMKEAAGYSAAAAEAAAKAAAYTATATALQGVADGYQNGQGDGQGGIHSGLVALSAGLSGDGTAANPGLLGALSGINDGAQQVMGGLEQLVDGLDEYADGTDEYADGVKKLQSKNGELQDGAVQLNDGLGELANGAVDYHQGTTDFFDGVLKLQDGISKLFDGTAELKDGTAELTDGAGELKDGTGELKDQTGNMDEQVDQQIKDLISEYGGRDFNLLSFASPRNVNIDSLQFVMLTAEIPAVGQAEAAVSQDEMTQTIWQRVKSLSKYFDGFSEVWHRIQQVFDGH